MEKNKVDYDVSQKIEGILEEIEKLKEEIETMEEPAEENPVVEKPKKELD